MRTAAQAPALCPQLLALLTVALCSIACGSPADVPACEDDNPCTVDRLEGESCVHEVATGRACDDDDACTEADACDRDGVCVGSPRSCGASGDCRETSCDPTAGCMEESFPIRCEDDNPCTADSCGVEGDCLNVMVTDGTACPGGDASECHAWQCNSGSCDLTPTSGDACDDFFACTVGDQCVAGTCEGVWPDATPAIVATARTFGSLDSETIAFRSGTRLAVGDGEWLSIAAFDAEGIELRSQTQARPGEPIAAIVERADRLLVLQANGGGYRVRGRCVRYADHAARAEKHPGNPQRLGYRVVLRSPRRLYESGFVVAGPRRSDSRARARAHF